MRVSAKHLGASNLVAHLCNELRLGQLVNNMVTWDEKQWKVSPGTLVSALVINALVDCKPLYNVEHFYEGMDLPLLFEEDIEARDLNDDALGRALDRLDDIDCRQLLGSIACRAANLEDMDIRAVHADTTSFSVYGDYAEKNTDGQFIEIVHGFSKDKRPDLKQLKFGLMVTNQGFPVFGDVISGNQSDNVWSKDVLDEFKVSFLETWNVAFVADSALITTENVEAMNKKRIKFISRFPHRFNLAEELIDKAYSNKKWHSLGPMTEGKKAAHYWTQTFHAEFAGKEHRFIVVRSSSLDRRKEKTLESLLKAEQTELEKLIKEVGKEEFQCAPDAQARLDSILKSHKMLHRLSGRIVETTAIKRKPGRPCKEQVTTPQTITTYGVALTFDSPTEKALEEWRQREATFVLITSVSEDLYDDYDVLKEYKGQINVEMRFRFLKDPVFVNAIYLKTPKRIQALGYVILIAVMIASLLEQRIRTAMEREKTTISSGARKKLDRPTARVLLDLLNTILVVYLNYEDRTERHFPNDIDPNVLQLLKFAGYDESIYLENPFKKLL